MGLLHHLKKINTSKIIVQNRFSNILLCALCQKFQEKITGAIISVLIS